MSLQQEIRDWLKEQGYTYQDNTAKYNELDFFINEGEFFLEAKEKNQHYRKDLWGNPNIPEMDMFILDDLSARKIICHAPNVILVIKDYSMSKCGTRLFLFNPFDLLCMPKTRCNRKMLSDDDADRGIYKGKWIFSLNNGIMTTSMHGVFEYIESYKSAVPFISKRDAKCYGDYIGEDMPIYGSPRLPEQKRHDLNITR